LKRVRVKKKKVAPLVWRKGVVGFRGRWYPPQSVRPLNRTFSRERRRRRRAAQQQPRCIRGRLSER